MEEISKFIAGGIYVFPRKTKTDKQTYLKEIESKTTLHLCWVSILYDITRDLHIKIKSKLGALQRVVFSHATRQF